MTIIGLFDNISINRLTNDVINKNELPVTEQSRNKARNLFLICLGLTISLRLIIPENSLLNYKARVERSKRSTQLT